MPNLATLIREAERMRPIHIAAQGPASHEPGPSASTQRVEYPSAELLMRCQPPLLAATPMARKENKSSSSPAVKTEPQTVKSADENRSEFKVRLTEAQLETLKESLAPTPEVMTLQEAAHYLRVSRGSVLEMVHEQALPATKLAGKWRFKRSALDGWMEGQLGSHPRVPR